MSIYNINTASIDQLISTGSLYGTSSVSLESITSSFALTSSYVNAFGVHGTIESASYALSSSNTVSASYGYSSSYALSASYSPPQDLSLLLSSSIFNNWTGSNTSFFYGTASNSNTASYLPVGTYSITSSVTLNALTASYITSSNINGTVNSASYAVTSSYLNPGATIYLSQSYITSDINATKPAWQEGLMFWDKENNTYGIYTNQPNLTLQIGQETSEQYYAGEDILAGDAITFSGSHAEYPVGYKALSDGFSNRFNISGVSAVNLLSGSRGYIVVQGRVDDIDTSPYPAGSILYISDTQPGKYVLSPPPQPAVAIAVGHCLKQDATTGKILVNISLTPEPIHPYIGMIDVPSISNVGSLVIIGTGSAALSSTADGLGIIRSYPIQSESFTLTSSFLDAQYVVATDNNGNPVYRMLSYKSSIDNI